MRVVSIHETNRTVKRRTADAVTNRRKEEAVGTQDDHLTQDLLLQFIHGEVPPQRFVERFRSSV